MQNHCAPAHVHKNGTYSIQAKIRATVRPFLSLGKEEQKNVKKKSNGKGLHKDLFAPFLKEALFN